MNIIEAIEDPKLFGSVLRDPASWAAWKVYLKALFGHEIKDKPSLKIFRKCTGLKMPPAAPAKESFVIVGRRGGKSFISSIIAVYLACFKDWRPSPFARGRGR